MTAHIGFVNQGAQVAGTGSTLAVTLPNGIRVGDLLLMQIAGRPLGTAGTNDTISVNNSWTLVASSSVRQEIGTADLRTEVWYKIADSTEVGGSPSNPTITAGSNWQGTTAGYSGQIICFSGVDQSSPFDATAVTSSGAAAATFTPTGITTATAYAVVVSFAATGDDNALNFNTANGYTILYSGASYDTTTGGDHAVACAVQEFASTGAKTCPTWNESAVGNDAWAGVTIALKPDSSLTYDAEETWMLTDGTSWGAVETWFPNLNTGAAADCQSAQGNLTKGTLGSYSGYGHCSFDATAIGNDIEFTFRSEVQSTNEHYPRIHWRDNEGTGNGVIWIEPLVGTGASFYLKRYTGGGGEELLGTISSVTTAVGDVIHLRIQHIGDDVKVRKWLNNAAEPGTWDLEVTDGVITDAGFITFSNYGGGATGDVADRYADLRVMAVSSGTTYTQNVSSSSTPVGTLLKQTNRLLTAGGTPAGVLIKQTQKRPASTTTPSGIVNKAMSRALTGGGTPAGDLLKQTQKRPAGSIASAGSIIRAISRSLTSATTSSGSVSKVTSRAIMGANTPSGTVVKVTSRALTSTTTPSGDLSYFRQILASLSGTVTSVGTLVRSTSRALAGSTDSAGALTRLTSKTLSGSVDSSGALAAIRSFLRSLSGTVDSSGALTKLTSRALTSSTTPSGDISKQTSRSIAATITSSGALAAVRSILRSLSGSVASSGALTKVTSRSLMSDTTSSGSLIKAISRALTGVTTSSGSVTKTTSRSLTSTTTSSGAITKLTSRALTSVTTPSGNITKLISRVLTSTTTVSGSLLSSLNGNIFVPLAKWSRAVADVVRSKASADRIRSRARRPDGQSRSGPS